MGVSCSPDLAQLYAAFWESKHFPSSSTGLNPPDVPFFGRFIDDVLCVVYAPSADIALSVAASYISYRGLELEWSVSEYNAVFLDLLVYIDPNSKQIGHKPWRKAMNHSERIPWLSPHPKDIKKGTFLGEISRLATLSSDPCHYLDALKDLGNLYVARGYPEQLVIKWTKDNCATRWQNRLKLKTVDNSPVFVLKTPFNPAWDSFNVKELGTVITNKWLDYCTSNFTDATELNMTSEQTAPATGSALHKVRLGRNERLLLDVSKLGFCTRRWLVSRKKTLNLSDVLAIFKKSVLKAHSNDNPLVDAVLNTWE
jgi:hypothetical protein